MGSIQLGVPESAVLEFKERYHLQTFIETGTYKGGTAAWAAGHFERVITIEANEKRFHGAAQRLCNLHPNIRFILGDSRVALKRELNGIHEPVLLWLDAHWVGDQGAKDSQGDECPLAEELDAILAWEHYAESVILIDDARLFTAPPPYPHDPAQWLTYDQITARLTPHYRVWIDEDVIFGVPK